MKTSFAVFVVVVSVLVYFLGPKAVQILKVGSGFTAQTVCTGVFVSNRNTEQLLLYELAGISAAVFGFEVNHDTLSVDVHFLQFVSKILGLPPLARSYFVSNNLGCRLGRTSFPIDRPDLSSFQQLRKGVPLDTKIDLDIQAFIDFEFTSAALIANHTRAVVVLHRGVVVAEGYQQHSQITADTPLLGWSMTKSVLGAIVAAAVQDGLVDLSTASTLIPLASIEDLLGMADVLDFSEDYSIAGSVPAMLFGGHGDVAAYALGATDSSRSNSPLPPSMSRPQLPDLPTTAASTNDISDSVQEKGEETEKEKEKKDWRWYYSSGVSNVLSREMQRYFGSKEDYWKYPFSAIFDRIGASSFVLETDAAGECFRCIL